MSAEDTVMTPATDDTKDDIKDNTVVTPGDTKTNDPIVQFNVSFEELLNKNGNKMVFALDGTNCLVMVHLFVSTNQIIHSGGGFECNYDPPQTVDHFDDVKTVHCQIEVICGNNEITENVLDILIDAKFTGSNGTASSVKLPALFGHNNENREIQYCEPITHLAEIKGCDLVVDVYITHVYSRSGKSSSVQCRRDGLVSCTSLTIPENKIELFYTIDGLENGVRYVSDVDENGFQLVLYKRYNKILLKRLYQNVTYVRGRLILFLKFSDDDDYQFFRAQDCYFDFSGPTQSSTQLHYTFSKHLALNKSKKFCKIKVVLDVVYGNEYGLISCKKYALDHNHGGAKVTRRNRDVIVIIVEKTTKQIGKLQREMHQYDSNVEYCFEIDDKNVQLALKHTTVESVDFNCFTLILPKDLLKCGRFVKFGVLPDIAQESLVFCEGVTQQDIMIPVANFALKNLNQGIEIKIEFLDFDYKARV